MAWYILDPAVIDDSGSVPWHITDTESINIPPKREMAVHGELLVEGEISLQRESRLRIEQ